MGKVGQYVSFQNGFAFKSKDFCEEAEFKVIKIKELKDGRVKFTSETACVEYMEGIEKYIVNDGDVLFALTGDPISKPNPLSWVGRVSLYRGKDKAVLNQRVCKMLPSNEVNPLYLYYYFRDNKIFTELAGKATGSASQANISTKTIEDTDIEMPDITTQNKIAEILDGLDRRIILNEKINKNLFEQAQSLYKAWFIDFLPFSNDRTMPTSWKKGTVNDIITIHDSKRIPLSGAERSHMEKIYPYYGASSLMDYVDNYIFDGIYLLLGEDGTVIDEKGFPILQYVDGKFWVNNHTHILTGDNGFSVEELYLFFSLTNIKGIVTGAVQQKVSQGNLKKIPAIIPAKDTLAQFDEIIQPMFEQIRKIRHENAELANIRDTLMPRLMSGEIDVSDIYC